jgi:hypothetical protein
VQITERRNYLLCTVAYKLRDRIPLSPFGQLAFF